MQARAANPRLSEHIPEAASNFRFADDQHRSSRMEGMHRNGQKKAAFKNSFEDISGSSFRLVSEGSTDAKVIGRVITKYTHPRTTKW